MASSKETAPTDPPQSGSLHRYLRNSFECEELYPRISPELTESQLKVEAIARGHPERALPLNKADLLHLLGDGSIHLSATRPYEDLLVAQAEVERLKTVLERERNGLAARNWGTTERKIDRGQAEKMSSSSRTKRRANDNTPLDHHEAKRMPSCDDSSISSSFLRDAIQDFLDDPLPFDNIEVDTAKEESHSRQRNPSRGSSSSSSSRRHDSGRADFSTLRNQRIGGPQLSTREILKHVQEDLGREEDEVPSFDKSQFPRSIQLPSRRNMKVCEARGRGYVVWYGSSGFEHSDWKRSDFLREFDSIWETCEEANLRARYVYYWRNCYDMPPEDMFEPKIEVRKGRETYHCHPRRSASWVVGVAKKSFPRYYKPMFETNLMNGTPHNKL